MPNHSIKETKEVLDFALSLQEALSKALEDGKVQIWELPLFWSPFMKMSAAFEGVKLVPQELGDLNPEELAELKQMVKDRLNLADDKLEAKVKDALNLVLDIAKFLGDVKK